MMAIVWLPSNICEYFFFDDGGCLAISEDQVKELHGEFVRLMKSIYENMGRKYEDIVKAIITEQDIDGVDFPLIAKSFQVEPLAKLLTPEIAEKLNLEEEVK